MSSHAQQNLPKRFYQNVEVAQGEGGWLVLLDGKPLRTPGKHLMAFTSPGLAAGVATEWGQQATHIDKQKMPFTSLVCIALDVASIHSAAMREELAGYAETDQLCYRDPDPAVSEEQIRLYDPLLVWAREGLHAEMRTTTTISPVAQTAATRQAFHREINRLNSWELAAVSLVCGITRSLIVGLGMVHQRITAKEAEAIATLEERMQAQQWGMDPVQQARIENWKRDLQAVEAFVAALP